MVNSSCGSKPTDLRTGIPADSLVYLETNDLGRALTAVTENEAFKAAAKTQPDFSALAGMKLAVAVTGFETKEQQVTEENSVLNFKPRFVAVVETNAWNYQALSFTENKLGEFINETYGGEVTLETSDKHGGKYFVWAAQDGRKAYALVRGSLVFFGNDESAMEKCLAVTRGEADSIAKNPKIMALQADSLASGYVSTDGIAQIANIVGISIGMGASEDVEVKSFFARVVPEIVRGSVIEATWMAKRLEDGRVEDSYTVYLEQETAKVLSETIVSAAAEQDFAKLMPKDFASVSRYKVKDNRIAWRGLLLTARTKTEQVSGKLLTAFSSSLFESYGVADPELFFGSITGPVQTIRFDTEGDEAVAIARFNNLASVKASLAEELRNASDPVLHDRSPGYFEIMWRSKEGERAAAIDENTIIIGDAASVFKCIAAANTVTSNLPRKIDLDSLSSSNSAVVTTGVDVDPQAQIVEVLSGVNEEKAPLTQIYATETRFNQNGIERRTVSSFGLIGTIIGRLHPNN